ncbi:16S rRNA (cytosine967-C5)-methyltransferase [Streptosporangium becharense]|uniref:16S rRNA (Cytosine967-C5)-methyltransferase n=1 Tax=Streptosporangium becharense TaxID=1816182 RepID=A0A7W9MFC4_9ACTN|nr:transcription antitermination factor NusB [Streptosporangium becharense]MBB2912824.1 16S rRNA (cytosine967-C5)-methyltransferase [Streptosporangium becharense]MBB5818351.1 16S rRNA (cytosine967-C5)-methyltransferase [Streptosporangium becharense]
MNSGGKGGGAARGGDHGSGGRARGRGGQGSGGRGGQGAGGKGSAGAASGGQGFGGQGSGGRGGQGSGRRGGAPRPQGGGAGRPGGRGTRPARPVRDEARNAAYDLLRAVDERDAYANLLMPTLLRERRLSGRDAGLATELAYGTLRGLGTYDEVVAACSDRAPEDIDPPLLDAIRLGVHQLLKTRIPPHAAVGTTVDLVRLRVGAGASKYANAVLRKVSTRSLEQWLAIVAPDPAADPVGHLAVAHSHPRWIVDALRDAVGGDADETAALLAADNERPRVALVARPGRSTVEELVASGAEPAAYSPYGAYLAEGDPAAVLAVAESRAAVQDEASQLVALALTRVPVPGRDSRWLDMCAGPGGKAGLLDAIAIHGDPAGVPAASGASARPGSAPGAAGPAAFGGGAHLVAAEVQYHRARLVWRTTRQAAVITADGTVPAWRPGAFDRVMLDAPCTGLGALRRRPEARWRRDPRSLAELGRLQRDLLGSAVDSVRPGGVVAYVTCSPHLAETVTVVGDLLRRRDDVETLDARAYLPEVEGLGDGPYAQFWPHRHGTDAMFLALLRRR